MADRTLRALARQYAKGELDKDSYRRSRIEFIEGVLAGEIRLPVNEYPAPRSLARSDSAGEAARKRERRRGKESEPGAVELEESDITSIMVTTDPTPQKTSPVAKAEPPAPPPVPESEPRPLLSYGLAAIGGIVLVGILIIVLLPKSPPQPGPAVATTTQPAATDAGPVETETVGPEPAEPEISGPAMPAMEPAPTLSRPASDLILKFLANKNWSETARAEFLGQWQALPEDQRAGAAQSGEMAQLNNGIYKKMLEERALSGLGDATASFEKQRSLVEFAAALGIHDSRLTVPPTTR
ncbi:MAG: hypothetical protein HYY48_12470 [Gammaproteobacteria bacterium]|nr:hypothetical protein [Gammaproteobacteria bacterium]